MIYRGPVLCWSLSRDQRYISEWNRKVLLWLLSWDLNSSLGVGREIYNKPVNEWDKYDDFSWYSVLWIRLDRIGGEGLSEQVALGVGACWHNESAMRRIESVRGQQGRSAYGWSSVSERRTVWDGDRGSGGDRPWECVALAGSLDFILRATGTWSYWLETRVLQKNRPTVA